MITNKVTLLNETVIDCLDETKESRIFRAFMEVGMKVLGADYSFAWGLKNLKSKNLELIYKSPNLPFTPTARKNGRNYLVIKTHNPIFVDDVRETPDVNYVNKYFKGYAIVPLIFKKVIHGSVVLCFKKGGKFSKEKKALAVLLGNSLAQAITIRRLVKKEQEARALSEKQEAHFRSLIENSYEIIVHIDNFGKIVYVSPSVKKVLGINKNEFVGKNINYFAKKENGASKVLGYIRNVIKHPHKRHVEEFKYKNKDGEIFYLESVATKIPEKEAGGGIVINIRDITEHKKLEEAKNAERLLREEKMKLESIADATHELRTPLAIIKGNIDLAKQGEEKNLKSLKNIIKDIDQETKHLSDIISDLALITSQRRSLGEMMSTDKVNLKELIKEVVERCRSIAYRKNITLATKNIDDVNISGNKLYLEKMLTNIIKNSINYGNQGGQTKIYTSASKGFVTINIEDNGIGISKQDLPHVFERFYRGDKSHSSVQSEGTGLGLSIVKWIAENHGGVVKVTSEENVGTTLSIMLPIRRF